DSSPQTGRLRNDIKEAPSTKIGSSHMAQRTFTLQEAQVLLPVLRLLLKQAIDGKKLIETIDAEFQALGQRIFLSGGLLVEIGKADTRQAERDKTVQRINYDGVAL